MSHFTSTLLCSLTSGLSVIWSFSLISKGEHSHRLLSNLMAAFTKVIFSVFFFETVTVTDSNCSFNTLRENLVDISCWNNFNINLLQFELQVVRIFFSLLMWCFGRSGLGEERFYTVYIERIFQKAKTSTSFQNNGNQSSKPLTVSNL